MGSGSYLGGNTVINTRWKQAPKPKYVSSPKAKTKKDKKVELTRMRITLVRKIVIAEVSKCGFIVLDKEERVFRNEIDQKGSLINWAKSQFGYKRAKDKASFLQRIVKSNNPNNIQLTRKEERRFQNQIEQTGGLVNWAKSQSQYIKILEKANPDRYKVSINKGIPLIKDSTGKLSINTKRNLNSFMKESKIDKIWKRFCKSHLENPNTPLRVGSKRIQAKSYIDVKTTPALPTKQLSTEVIFEGWSNGYNKSVAKNLIKQNPTLSFQELLIKIIILMDEDEKIYVPYIWWIDLDSYTKKKRVIYQDANGDNFAKIDGKWQMAYSVKAVGVLVGRQGGDGYEDLDLPHNSYFVVSSV